MGRLDLVPQALEAVEEVTQGEPVSPAAPTASKSSCIPTYRLHKIEVKRSDAIDQIRFVYDDKSEWEYGHDGGKVDQLAAVMTPGEHLVRVSHERFENYRCAAAGVEFETNLGRCFKYAPFQMASGKRTEITTLWAAEGKEIIALDIKKGVLQGVVEQPSSASAPSPTYGGSSTATTSRSVKHRGPSAHKATTSSSKNKKEEWYVVATCSTKEEGEEEEGPQLFTPSEESKMLRSMTGRTKTSPKTEDEERKTKAINHYAHFESRNDALKYWRRARGWANGKKRGRCALLIDVKHCTVQRRCGGSSDEVKESIGQAAMDGMCSGKSDSDVSMVGVVWVLVKQLSHPKDLIPFTVVTLLLGLSGYFGLCANVLTGHVLGGGMAADVDSASIVRENWTVRATCQYLTKCEGEGVTPSDFRRALILTFILVKVLEKLLYVLNVYLHHNSCEAKNINLRAAAFQHVLSMDQPFFDTRSMSDIHGSMNVHALNNLISWNIPYLAMRATKMVMIVYFMACISWPMTLLSVAAMLVVKFGVLEVVAKYEKNVHKMNRKLDHMNNQIKGDAFEMISSVKAFSTEERHIDEFEQFQSRKMGILNTLVTFRCLREFGCGMLNVGTFAAVLYWGVSVIADQHMSASQLTAFFLIFNEFQDVLASFKFHWEVLVREFPDIDRFLSLMQTKATIVSGTTDIVDMKGDVEFREVEFEYPSRPGQKVLKGLTHRFKPQQMTAIVGDSGAGKSTITKLLMRTYDSSAGAVLVDGVDVREASLQSLHDQIAVVSQAPELFNCSLAENIGYGKAKGEATMEEIEAAARLANCYDFIQGFRGGFDTFAGSRGAQLSGGQRQRIAIARAAIRDPKILILDEATSALDAESERVVQKALERVMEGRTTIVVAHRLSTVCKAAEIICMKDGRIVERGTHSELLALGGHYSYLVSQQLVGKEEDI